MWGSYPERCCEAARSRDPGPFRLPLAVAAALLAWRTRDHILWLIAAGALLGALGVV